MRLSDTIEQFIKAMLPQEEKQVELKRNELAEYFKCAPSQINYVLATRFTPDHGYVIESRRGGGGYIRIVRIEQSAGQHMRYLIHERIGDTISEGDALRLIAMLHEQGTITLTEGRLMRAAVSPEALSVPLPIQMKDTLRARILRSMIITMARQQPDVNSTQEAHGGA